MFVSIELWRHSGHHNLTDLADLNIYCQQAIQKSQYLQSDCITNLVPNSTIFHAWPSKNIILFHFEGITANQIALESILTLYSRYP